MYSLYRAWLSLGPCGTIPNISSALPPSMPVPLNLSVPPANQIPGAPDVTLQVGPRIVQFAAHKAVLATHSGFFKAALANHRGEYFIPRKYKTHLKPSIVISFRFYSYISTKCKC